MNAQDNNIFIHEYKDAHLTNCIMVVGFPSMGLISSITANYIVQSLKLERIAAIVSPEFPPFAILRDGVPSPPVRIYAGTRVCKGPDGEHCDQVVVIMAEFMPRADVIIRMVDIILQWAKKKGVGTIVTLEGINMEAVEKPQTLGVGTTANARKMMAKYDIQEMTEGMVLGVSGLLLAEGDRTGADVICLLGPAKTDMPDARGAANLLEYLGKMLPELKLDPDPLLKEAETIESGMKQALEGMKQTKQKQEQSFLYG